MTLEVPNVLDSVRLAECRKILANAEWADGCITAGHQSARAKNNLQLPENSPAARRLGEMVIGALERHPLFISAALPLRVFPPLFNRYEAGHGFGAHIDNAIRQVSGTPHRVRTDLSATLFLSDPDEYDGGELWIEEPSGIRRVKLGAGSMVLYSAGTLHRVEPVTRGARLASFFWVQSMVRDEGQRALLFDLDVAIQSVAGALPDHPALVRLTGTYHNLLRRWADAG